jgi:type IV pilus assembly protein PilV
MFIENTKTGFSRVGKMIFTRKQRGDTMIEVLVTVIILAVGVLGAAAMQVTTIQNLNSSYSASVAAMVAEDFSERMRANPIAALAGSYGDGSDPGGFPNCAANACTTAELATYDLGSWWQVMTGVLPVASGEITRIIGTNTFVVTVRWDGDRSGSAGIECPVQSADDLDCYRFNVTI